MHGNRCAAARSTERDQTAKKSQASMRGLGSIYNAISVKNQSLTEAARGDVPLSSAARASA
jgi:hypothetical protein